MRRRPRPDVSPGEWTGPHDRPRVLVESPDGAERWAVERILERAGYDVETCPGPEEHSCPLLHGERCALADGADLVWNSLRVHGAGGEVLEALVRISDGTPIVIEIAQPDEEKVAHLLDAPHARRTHFPVTPETLVSTVGNLIARHLGRDSGAPR